MGALKQQPKYNVVSMRITDEEKEMLSLMTRSSRKSVSEVMREALRLLEPGLVMQAKECE